MSDPYDAVTLFRMILEGESDANSPGAEEFFSQVRENLEAILMLLAYTGTGGTATSDPPDDTTGYFYDTAAGFSDDEHNGRSLMIIDGLAAGNIYTIDDTVAASDRVECTGDNLYADGVRSGDKYKIFYNIKHTSGHTHDDVDSPYVVLADDQVTQAKIAANAVGQSEVKTGTGSGGGSIGAGSGQAVAMNDYCFSPNTYVSVQADIYMTGYNSNVGDQVGRFGFYNTSGSTRGTNVRWRYITATDKPFIYLVRNKNTGESIISWTATDPPNAMWGWVKNHDNIKPKDFEAPIILFDGQGNLKFDADWEEIIVWNYPLNDWRGLMDRSDRDKKFFYKMLEEDFDFNPGTKLFEPKNLSQI